MSCPPSLNTPIPNVATPTCDKCPCQSAVAGSAASDSPVGFSPFTGHGNGFTNNSIRYGTGEIRLAQDDLRAAGFGTAWRHVRTWGNQMSDNYDGPNGNNWFCSDFPYLTGSATTTLVIVG